MPGAVKTVVPAMTVYTPAADAETLSALVAAIYDAAIDPSSWSAVLGSARDFVGGHSAAIFAKSLSGAADGIYHDDGVMDPLYKRLYFEEYGRIDPSNAVHLFAELEHWLEVFRTYYGPVHKALAALEPQGQKELEQDLLALIGQFNRSGDATMVVPSEYLEAVVSRR